jgi:phage tail tube protein FII
VQQACASNVHVPLESTHALNMHVDGLWHRYIHVGIQQVQKHTDAHPVHVGVHMGHRAKGKVKTVSKCEVTVSMDGTYLKSPLQVSPLLTR